MFNERNQTNAFKLTDNVNFESLLCVDPFPRDQRLVTYQRWIFQRELQDGK